MTMQSLGLSGQLRQADAAALAEQLRGLLDAADDSGAVDLGLSDVTALEFGPLQVLVCAAAEARKRGLNFRVTAPADGPIRTALTVHALHDALTISPADAAQDEPDADPADDPKSAASRGRRRPAAKS